MAAPSLDDVSLVYHGRIVHSLPSTALEILEDHLLGVSSNGLISFVTSSTPELLARCRDLPGVEFIQPQNKHSFLLPGWIDTHLHAPQYLFAGTALDVPLMEWLNKYTLPSESRIDQDPHLLGKKVYETLVKRLIQQGTTMAALYGTKGVEANMVLARAFHEAGVRALVGKVNADQHSPSHYIETTSDSLSATKAFITSMRELYPSGTPEHQKLVWPCVTPRFIPTCSAELLRGLAQIAAAEGVDIQSHLSESSDEVAFVKALWGDREDADIFKEVGLLTDQALFAHCTHLTPQTMGMLTSSQSGISHCPLSNTYFSSRAFPAREAIDTSTRVGLGSDIAGGYALGIQESMRWSVGVSRGREGRRRDNCPDAFARSTATEAGGEEKNLEISWRDSIYLATLGGARAVHRESFLGNFEQGKSFDAQLIVPGETEAESDVDLFDAEWSGGGKDMDFELVLEKWWALGGKADRRGVWVAGRRLL